MHMATSTTPVLVRRTLGSKQVIDANLVYTPMGHGALQLQARCKVSQALVVGVRRRQ